MDRLESIINLFGNAAYPVAVADGELNIVWQNSMARRMPELGEDITSVLKLSLDEGGTGIVFREGSMHTGGCISAAVMGEYIAIIWTRYAGGDSVFDPDGAEAVMQAVRNSVHTIAIAADTLDMDDPEKKTDAICSIKRSSYNLLRACEHMGIISRYYTGALRPKLQNVDIKELVGSLVEGAKSIIDRRADIKLQLPEKGVAAMVDVKLVERAVLNLLLNAIVHAGDDAHITVRLSEQMGRAMISVSDDGVGMGENALARAADPYFSVRPGMEGAGSRAGSGMGLTVAKICAGVHGGMLLMSSREGSGTNANLVLPLGEPEGETLRCSVGSYIANRFTNLYVEMGDVAVMPG